MTPAQQVIVTATLPDYPGYEIQADGSVWSTTGWRGHSRRRLATPLDPDGYPYVRMVVNGKRLRATVHSLVARAFLGAPAAGQQVRHLNGDRTDARAENLSWGTAKENAADRDGHGTTARGSQIHQSKLTEADVLAIRDRRAAGELLRTIAADYGVSEALISQIALRQWWSHL